MASDLQLTPWQREILEHLYPNVFGAPPSRAKRVGLGVRRFLGRVFRPLTDFCRGMFYGR